MSLSALPHLVSYLGRPGHWSAVCYHPGRAEGGPVARRVQSCSLVLEAGVNPGCVLMVVETEVSGLCSPACSSSFCVTQWILSCVLCQPSQRQMK